MVKLYFTGIKHSGKTTQAKLVAQHLALPFSDADDLILSHIQEPSVREFYKIHGKESFMEKEFKAVEEFEKANDSFILSLGGGAADNTPLMNLMKKTGKIIYLKRKESEMLPVILKHGIPAFLDPDNLELSFHKVYSARDAIYSDMADLVVDLGSYRDKAETAQMLLEILKEKNYV